MSTRSPAVAGRFYPGGARRLRHDVEHYLEEAAHTGPCPKALIAPHAGYMYSGPIAGSGYARVRSGAGRIERVVLLGPTHYVPVDGLAASSAQAFKTPLGQVEVDAAAVGAALAFPQVETVDEAHRREHSLEVQLPFLQVALGSFRIVPLLVGRAETHEVAEVLEALWGGEETLVVVSSDLSHYHDDRTARRLDAATARAIERLDDAAIRAGRACGGAAVRGLLCVARRRGLEATTLDLRTSAATAGTPDQVVGYGAFALVPERSRTPGGV